VHSVLYSAISRGMVMLSNESAAHLFGFNIKEAKTKFSAYVCLTRGIE
jgi:hypothetical protein